MFLGYFSLLLICSAGLRSAESRTLQKHHGITACTAEQSLPHLSSVFWSQSGDQAKRHGKKKEPPPAKSVLFWTNEWSGKNKCAVARGSSTQNTGMEITRICGYAFSRHPGLIYDNCPHIMWFKPWAKFLPDYDILKKKKTERKKVSSIRMTPA